MRLTVIEPPTIRTDIAEFPMEKNSHKYFEAFQMLAVAIAPTDSTMTYWNVLRLVLNTFYTFKKSIFEEKEKKMTIFNEMKSRSEFFSLVECISLSRVSRFVSINILFERSKFMICGLYVKMMWKFYFLRKNIFRKSFKNSKILFKKMKNF